MNNRFRSGEDFRKSLETRLLKTARDTGSDLQRLRRKTAFDRLLARIFHNQNDSSFFLKGGYAMELRFERARATRDIDLTCVKSLHHLSKEDTIEEIREMLIEFARIDLDDFFSYKVGQLQLDLENAPYGGARFPISSMIGGRLFVNFHIDVGIDILASHTDSIDGTDWLGFCEILPPHIIMISKEQQFAEKIHAYSLPREEGRSNSRVKDLIDLLLILSDTNFDFHQAKEALKRVFQARKTHLIPQKLSPPPANWEERFAKMASECALNPSMQNGYEIVSDFYQKVVLQRPISVGR